MDSKNNHKLNNDINDYENWKFIHNKFSITKNQIINKNIKTRKLIIYLLILLVLLSLLFLFILIHKFYFTEKKLKYKENITENITVFKKEKKEKINEMKDIPKEKYPIYNSTHSPKWIVITTINKPNRYTNKLVSKTPKKWKIVVVGDIKTNNKSWSKFKNSTKLFYLSIEDQLKLNYNITKYIPFNSYSRKNIGYLYAIQHGAKEIYETDDDIYIFGKRFLDKTIDKYSLYAENNESLMINPYNFFGKPTIWPRGFRLKDIYKKSDTKFYRIISKRAELKPLINQFLLNVDPDVDSIFRYTRMNRKNSMNHFFYFMGNLMYLPGNFVPINSKNTKYLYDIFPSLALPTTLPMRIVDIWRGYIMQRYAWIYNGTVFYNSPCADNKRNYKNITSDFLEERDLYFKLDELLNSLKMEVSPDINTPEKFLINMIEILVNKSLLGANDLIMYKAFINDLNSFGYKYNLNFNRTIERNHKRLLNTYSEFKFYFTRKNKVLLQNNDNRNISLFKHKDSYARYDDILLIINYNYKFLTKLNDYILKLYHDYFPHIIFIYPGFIEDNATYVSCPDSSDGYYSYVCLKKVYELYPNKKGYLFLMDDNYLKVWELENLDFNIPWFYHYFIRNKNFINKSYMKTKALLDIHPNWKKKYEKFLGSSIVAYAVSDIYYLPKEDFANFCSMVTFFHNKTIFLETAVPTMMGIMLKEKYQIIYFVGLWNEGRKKTIEYLKKSESQVTIHPIKFSNITYQEEVIKYIYIMNGRDY